MYQIDGHGIHVHGPTQLAQEHADEGGVLVGDSIEGKVTLSKREFLARWRGVLLCVDGE